MSKNGDKNGDKNSKHDDRSHAPGSWLPEPSKMDDSDYGSELLALQIELVKLQNWVKATGERMLLLFEGRDTAGKGGTIKRFRENINPRGAPQIALPKPSDVETTQWYFQRYVEHLPAAGDMVFFDRSWYNRAGVERVMGFCTREQYTRFMRQVPFFEQSLVDDGIHLFKLWLAVNRDEQRRRLDARRENPLKTWKLSPIDEAASSRFDDYTEAQNDVFLLTHQAAAPWWVINANEKKPARLNTIRLVLSQMDYEGKDSDVARPPDAAIVGTPRDLFPEVFAG
jgi:polyphosphate kinase 2